jgi:hypothetical protein
VITPGISQILIGTYGIVHHAESETSGGASKMIKRSMQSRRLFPEQAAPGADNPWLTSVRALRVKSPRKMSGLAPLELCAGAGGQALGIEHAGIEHEGLIEIDAAAGATLRLNRPSWNVIQGDLNTFDGGNFRGVDIVCGGLPCPSFSVAGKQLRSEDERLFRARSHVC